MNRLLLTVLAAAALLAAGCGDGLVPVKGTVTLDSVPIADGEIIFEAADGSSAPAAGPIRNGGYELRVPPGAKKVLVNASKPGPVDPVMKVAIPIPAVPRRYNADTTLTADVKPGAKDPIDFPLSTKP